MIMFFWNVAAVLLLVVLPVCLLTLLVVELRAWRRPRSEPWCACGEHILPPGMRHDQDVIHGLFVCQPCREQL